MARNFNTNDIITFPVPAALIGVDGGPLTVVTVVKLNASAYHAPIYTKTSGGSHAWSMEFDTTGGLHANYVTGTTARNVGTVSTGAYFVAIFRKDASGTFQPVGRFLTGAGFTTDSGNITAASTLIDGPALDSGGLLQFGKWGTTDFSNNIDVAAVAVWSSYVADGTVTTFTSWANITSNSPTYWAKFEGSTVTDSASQTPTITNTTTASDPSGFFGAADQTINGNGITSSQAVGNSTLSTTYTTNASGITSSEKLGSPTLTATYTINANGVPDSAAVGAPVVTATASINANGINSQEQLGSATLSSTYTINANGINSQEQLGSAELSSIYTIDASGVPSSEQLGSHEVQPGAVTINANGIESSALVGSALALLAQVVNANGIATLEALGTPTISVGDVTISASGIVSSEVVGSAQLDLSITPSGIPSDQSVGTPSITVTAAGISAGNIASDAQLGSPAITASFTIEAHGIRSEERIGAAQLYVPVFAHGIGSTESVGAPTITVGDAIIDAAGILSAAGLGTPIITALPLIPPTPDTLLRMRIGQTILMDDTGQSNIRINESETILAI